MGELWGEEYNMLKHNEDKQSNPLNRFVCSIFGHSWMLLSLPEKWYGEQHRACKNCGKTQYFDTQNWVDGIKVK